MADVATAPAATPKKVPKAPKVKKVKTKSTHPTTKEMVTAAIKSLNERGGSSLQAIKKYIAATYKVDGDKLAPFIRRYLKSAVTSGALSQTKGKGASGSFKLAVKGEKVADKKPKLVKKSAPKAVKPKKAVSTPKKAKAAKPKKSPAKKTKSPPKVKVPKPKKAAAKSKSKKAAPKK